MSASLRGGFLGLVSSAVLWALTGCTHGETSVQVPAAKPAACRHLPLPVSSTDPPDPRRTPPEAVRALIEDASDEEYVRRQDELSIFLGPRDLLDSVTPQLAEAYTRRWLRLAARPRSWFVAQGLWEADGLADDIGPMNRLLRGDPALLAGADQRLHVASALAAGKIASEARLRAVTIVAKGGHPVAAALRASAAIMDERERRALDQYGLLEPATPIAEPVPSDTDAAVAWISADAERPLSRLADPVRRTLARGLAEAADPRPLSPAHASSVLAQYAADFTNRTEGWDLLRQAPWPIDLSALPGPFARTLLDRRVHVRLSQEQRARLQGDMSWLRDSLRRPITDLGVITQIARWRMAEAAPVLRETANHPGNFYPADAAGVALAALGDERALEGLVDMLRRGPAERVFQLLSQPMPYAPTEAIVDALLEAASDGRSEASRVAELMNRWFGAQVASSTGDGPHSRAATIAAWRTWWTNNRSAWCWDPWSARFWPVEVWLDD